MESRRNHPRARWAPAALVALVAGLVAPAAGAQLIERSSVDSSGIEGNANSGGGDFYGAPAISSDGRHVAFVTWASNLASGDTNGTADIYARDHATDTTTRISVGNTGEQVTRDCYRPAISGDGRFIAFQTSGVFDARDLNSTLDIYLVDRDTDDDGIFDEVGARDIILVSLNFLETAAGSGPSETASIDADGATIAFESAATDLAATADLNGFRDIYVHDRLAGENTLASVDALGGATDGHSHEPWISADGGFVAFQSWATDLVGDPDLDGFLDVYLRDLTGETNERISEGAGGEAPNSASHDVSLSTDGRYVCFLSDAGNLVTPGEPRTLRHRVFVKDRTAGTMEVAAGSGLYFLLDAVISGSGRYVALWTEEDLIEGDTSGLYDIYVVDRDTGEAQLATLDNEGDQALCGVNCTSGPPALASDASHVAFQTSADDLVDEDANGFSDIFRRKVGADMLVLTGDASVEIRARADFSFSGGPPSGTYHVYASKRDTGSVLFGHAMDIGPAKFLEIGTLDASGAGSYRTPRIPPRFAGRTVYLEILAIDAMSQYYDSNAVSLDIL